ncbi:MAG: tetratricopeptide repeat protein [Methylovulum sp.]|nr:tetratricopeptide repeat protein [Methylovulum sp.]
MPTSPKVFVSATSGDLRTMRSIVKEALLTIGCHPVEQTNFPPDYRSVHNMLHDKISDCQPLVHIVGLRYGAEPEPPATQRRSYTQLEYDIGRELQRKRGDKRFRVYTFVCPEDFPYDKEPDVEDDDKCELQRRHRAAILDGAMLYGTPADSHELEKRVLALQEEVIELRRRQMLRDRMILAVDLAVLLALGGIAYSVHELQKNTQTISEQGEQQTKLLQDFSADTRAKLEEIIAATRQQSKLGEQLSPQQRYDIALSEVAFKHNLTPKDLKAAIDAWTAKVQTAPNASAYDLALAEYKANHFDKAAEQAGKAYDQAMQARQQATSDAIKAAHLEGDAYNAMAKYELALVAYRKGAALLDKGQQPLQWAKEHNYVAAMLFYLACYQEAETLWQDILTVREQQLGANHAETANIFSNLAQVLRATNRLAEAEPLMRRALAIDEQSYGKEHPSVATNLNNLAQLLQATNRLDQAEPLMKRMVLIFLQFSQKTGHQHPNLQVGINNYQNLLAEMNTPAAESKARLDQLGKAAGFSPDEWLVLHASLTGPHVIKPMPGSQAERVGLQPGDMITRYASLSISSAAQLIELIGKTKGHDIPLEIVRDGKLMKFSVAEGKLGVELR